MLKFARLPGGRDVFARVGFFITSKAATISIPLMVRLFSFGEPIGVVLAKL
jgi:hypothetical protein